MELSPTSLLFCITLLGFIAVVLDDMLGFILLFLYCYTSL